MEYKIMIIDDDRKMGNWLETELKRRGHYPIYFNFPDSAIKYVKKDPTFDLVFIDLQYDNCKNYDGAKVAEEISSLCSTSALILITAYGETRINDYIGSGFHAYFSKYEEGKGYNLDKMNSELDECMETAIVRLNKRVKTKYSYEELQKVEEKLDQIESVMVFLEKHFSRNINNSTIVAGLYYQNNEASLETKMDELKKVVYSKNKEKTLEALKLPGRNSISTYFQLRNPNGTFRENAKMCKQLIRENPEKWTLAKSKLKPLKKIVDTFL